MNLKKLLEELKQLPPATQVMLVIFALVLILLLAAFPMGGTSIITYQDPDGTIIELQIDNFGADARKGLEFLSQFQSNPALHGKLINPETYLAAWQKGATLRELHEQSFSGAFAQGAAPIPQRLLQRRG